MYDLCAAQGLQMHSFTVYVPFCVSGTHVQTDLSLVLIAWAPAAVHAATCCILLATCTLQLPQLYVYTAAAVKTILNSTVYSRYTANGRPSYKHVKAGIERPVAEVYTVLHIYMHVRPSISGATGGSLSSVFARITCVIWSTSFTRI